MDSTKTGFRLGYRADIEGLRAIAILLVVATHAGVTWLPGGFVGVDVFYVPFGYLITGSVGSGSRNDRTDALCEFLCPKSCDVFVRHFC